MFQPAAHPQSSMLPYLYPEVSVSSSTTSRLDTTPSRHLCPSPHGMWLNRYGGHPPPASASPLPQRRPSHLTPTQSPQRPGLTPRTSSLSLLLNGSTDSLPREARQPNGSGLKYQLDATPTESVADPLDILHDILGPPFGAAESNSLSTDLSHNHQAVLEDVEFGELSLREFVDAAPSPDLEEKDEVSSHSFEECRSGHPYPS